MNFWFQSDGGSAVSFAALLTDFRTLAAQDQRARFTSETPVRKRGRQQQTEKEPGIARLEVMADATSPPP